MERIDGIRGEITMLREKLDSQRLSEISVPMDTGANAEFERGVRWVSNEMDRRLGRLQEQASKLGSDFLSQVGQIDVRHKATFVKKLGILTDWLLDCIEKEVFKV